MSDTNFAAREVSKTVWFVEEWYVWPIAWVLAGTNYVQSMLDFIERVVRPVVDQGGSFRKLHLLSHGNERTQPGTGVVMGRYIAFGKRDRLDTSDFDGAGRVYTSTMAEAFLSSLRRAMAPGGKLIFSACGQGDGELLYLISRHVGKGVTVSGYRGIGHPFGSGNIAWRDGVMVSD